MSDSGAVIRLLRELGYRNELICISPESVKIQFCCGVVKITADEWNRNNLAQIDRLITARRIDKHAQRKEKQDVWPLQILIKMWDEGEPR